MSCTDMLVTIGFISSDHGPRRAPSSCRTAAASCSSASGPPAPARADAFEVRAVAGRALDSLRRYLLAAVQRAGGT